MGCSAEIWIINLRLKHKQEKCLERYIRFRPLASVGFRLVGVLKGFWTVKIGSERIKLFIEKKLETNTKFLCNLSKIAVFLTLFLTSRSSYLFIFSSYLFIFSNSNMRDGLGNNWDKIEYNVLRSVNPHCAVISPCHIVRRFLKRTLWSIKSWKEKEESFFFWRKPKSKREVKFYFMTNFSKKKLKKTTYNNFAIQDFFHRCSEKELKR